MTNYEDGAVAWRPICAGFFTDDDAQVMCEMLSYKYGRKYFTLEVAYREPNSSASSFSYKPVDYVYCNHRYYSPPDQPASSWEGDNPKPQGEEAGESGALENEGGKHRRLRNTHDRELLSPLIGEVNTPPDSPYTCTFRLGECDYTGPLTGIECSNEELPPAPPPPPSPPNAPGRPPTLQHEVEQIGGYYAAPIEPNLCDHSDDPDCLYAARAQARVPDAADPSVQTWAPVCAPPDFYPDDLATIICKQLIDWPYNDGIDFVHGRVYAPFAIPEEPPEGEPGLFRPSQYTTWLTVVDGDPEATAVQQLTFQTSTTPCEQGMLSFNCEYMAM